MKKILICGMLLGFLTSSGFAQRRAVQPGALPSRGHAINAGSMGANVGVSPNVGMSPTAATGHNGISPSAVASGTSAKNVGSSTTTVKPNAATMGATKSVDPNAANGNASATAAPNAAGTNTAATVAPNANTTDAARTVDNTTMDHVTVPNAAPAGDRAGVNPNQ